MMKRSELIFVMGLFLVVSYLQDVKPLLDARCVECHSTGAHTDMSSYPFLTQMPLNQPGLVDLMIRKATAKQMPPGNRPKLTAEQLAVLQGWQDGGLAP